MGEIPASNGEPAQLKQMNATLSRNELSAALLFASKDETRYTLTGVCIEYQPGKQPKAIATDGRRLAVIETMAEQWDCEDAAESVTLKPDMVKAIVSFSKAVGGKNMAWIRFVRNPGAATIEVQFVGCAFSINIEANMIFMEGDYPDYKACIPAGEGKLPTVKKMAVNSSSVGDFAKAAKLMGADSPCIAMNIVSKDGAIEVKLDRIPNFYGLLMQSKMDNSVEFQPEFLEIVKQFAKPEETEEEENEQ